ncbi:hypothetical protein D9758_017937 [Tetrapyrgos nigripes]|uniref:Uncharacterized protein n=1 Tax=Tetrapyrgos nigripes TaxID=182062 RepID=A0A8H5ETL6_9AGAR|nr:hypothetical protein D9758_017937 [Tetrapyrgos nigripes]
MVGAINPTSQDMFDQFKMAAQATSGNATVNPPPSNQGQGAFATASPSANPAPTLSSSSSSTADSTSSPTASQTPSPSTNHTVNTAAIAGGSSAAAAVVVIAIALFFCIHRRRRRQTRRQQQMTHPFTYSPPNTGMSEQFPIMRSVEPNTPPSQHQTFFGPGPRHQNSNLSMTVTSPPSSHTFPAEVYSASDGLRAPPPLHPLRPQQSQEPQEMLPSRMNSVQATDGSDSSTVVAPVSGHGMNALAKEVAAVLMQTSAFVYQGKDSRAAQINA